ncbi:hypothetical protein GCM10009743_52390 [Kribbella swartbergensis]
MSRLRAQPAKPTNPARAQRAEPTNKVRAQPAKPTRKVRAQRAEPTNKGTLVASTVHFANRYCNEMVRAQRAVL